ncbi:unnamed protein product, partial [Polarella glacialis]
PPLSGPPPPPGGGITPPGGVTPTGGLTPKGGFTPAGSQFATPRTPPPMSGTSMGSWMPATPKNLPLVPMGPMGVSRGIVNRGEQPEFAAAPFISPYEIQPSEGPHGDMPLPENGTATFGGSAFGPVPPPPPPPPPPPKEDDPTFVRRVRLAYIDKASKVHQLILQEEQQDVAWAAPEWVYQVTLMSPYIASAASIMCHVMIHLAFSTKFGRVEEMQWYYAVTIALGITFGVLEVMRCAVITIVELRKFEIRRRLVGGDFLKSRIRKMGPNAESELKLRRKPPPKPAVPLVAPRQPPKSAPPPPPPAKAPVSRPSFLPMEGPAGGTGMSSMPGIPAFRTANGQGLPLGAPPPPRPAALGAPGVPPINGGNIQGRSPVNSARGNGTLLTPMGTPGGSSLLPGRFDQTPLGTPKGNTPMGTPGGSSLLPGRMGGTGSRGGGGFDMPPPPPLPGGMPPPPGSAVTGVTQALTEKLKASRVSTPPPPPSPGQGRPSQPHSPPSAAGGPMSFSRPNSRPTSHRSGDGSKTPPKPPTPPPPGTLQQTRAKQRAQQDV